MEGIAPMAATFPWMVTPGNHEADCNYTYDNYRQRFAAQNFTRSSSSSAQQPNPAGSGSSRWYSFNHGPVSTRNLLLTVTCVLSTSLLTYVLTQ